MPFFLCKLNPPRPSFSQDMTDAERSIMMAHVGYWNALVDKGTALVFGPVADPKGTWGVGIVEVQNDDEVRALTANDPAITGGIGLSYDILPMPRAISRLSQGA